ncbi:MAG: bifunctional glutamate N-acetyltransferase/amino-acid acetyltransferase ArgJ [Rhodospirillales bacterium]
MADRSPLAPDRFPDLAPVAGLEAATCNSGLRYKGRPDVLLCRLAEGTTVGGTLTRSKCRAAPVDWCARALAGGSARALLVNAGNANAFTGGLGLRAVETCVEGLAERLACRPSRIFAASTGVIGEPLKADTIAAHFDSLLENLGETDWEAAARAISTTDTYPKGASATARIGDVPVTLSAIAKGSGMIAPDMATMLAFFFTDAALPASVVQDLIAAAVEQSFNRITVDSDTSTSDTALMFATGLAGNSLPASADDPALDDFRAALDSVALDLAHQIVRDGEGASKFITVSVTGAENDGAAKRIALAIANSPLVKTAIAGEDANWGRIVMAVGKAGEAADRDRLSVSVGGVVIAAAGERVAGYDEAPVAAHMRGSEILIETDVGVGGPGKATVWTCDLTHGYISINADYRS